MFYDNFRAACASRGTTLTGVLRELNISTGATGRWQSGSYPTLNIVMKIAEHLKMSLDELVYGLDTDKKSNDSPDIDEEFYYIISRIPEDRQQMCKDFLKTHMVVPEKYENRKKA